ncbi:flocculation protein FLO11 [Vigna umbellata]|uniref:flocculation protein FLO11 n=1 Tax=Vigna umbellata TaxID=87088 RepID=UPI001F5FA201|nr:flocculation protein FLO11 [Vigna umbellata]
MKGVGGSNPYFFSPVSSLSAFAAPFSVNPYPSSDVLSMDSGTHTDYSIESEVSAPPIHYQPYGYDFFSNPVRELDSTAQYPQRGFPSYAARSSLVEAQPYHVPSAIHDHSSLVPLYHWSSLTSPSDWPSLEEANNLSELGFSGQKGVCWERFCEFNGSGKGKQVGVGSSSLPSKAVPGLVEEIMNHKQANGEVKDSVGGEVSYITDRENYMPAISRPLPDTSSWWGNLKSMPVEFLGSSSLQSPSMPVETRHETPLMKAVADSGNNHLSNIGSYDKHSRHIDKSSKVDTVSSMPRTGLITDMNIDDIISDQHVGYSSFYNTKEASVRPCPGISGCFDSTHIRGHLGRNEPSPSNKAMGSDKTVLGDDFDYIFRGRTEYQTPHANMNTSSLRPCTMEDVNVEKSFEGGDRCNPAEDSPCWKGASAAHFSYFQPSAVLPQEYVHKKESSFGPIIHESQHYLLNTDSNTKKSAENSNGYQGTGSSGSPRKFSVTNFAYDDFKLGSAVNGGPFPFNPNCGFGLQVLDVTKMKGNSLPAANATNSESGSSQMEYQVAENNKLVTQKQHTSCIGDAKAGCNLNKFLEHGATPSVVNTTTTPSVVNTTTTPSVVNTTTAPSTTPSVVNTTTAPSSVVNTTTAPSSVVNTSTTPSVVNTTATPSVVNTTIATSSLVNTTTATSSVVNATTTFSSPSSVVNTTATPVNTAGRVTTEKLNVQMLVNTMQNLSELLLYHCENDVCELKERDCNVLKHVISNLNTCALKTTEQIAPAQECLYNQPETFNCARESREFHQNASFKRGQLTKLGPEISKVENPLVSDANLHFRSAKPLWKLSNSISSRRGAREMTMTDGMTKDLKRTLNENFHDEVADPQAALYKNLWLEAEAELCSVYYKARYNQIKIVMDNHSYKEREIENQSKSEVVPNLRQNQSSETKAHNYPNSGSTALNLSVLDSPSLEGLSWLNFFTDVNKPNNAMTPGGSGDGNLDKAINSYIVSSSNEEPERNHESSVMARYQVLKARVDQSCIDTTKPEELSDMEDKSSPRGTDNQNAVSFCQDSPIPEKNSTDYEASVVARFHILKSRLEGSSSISLEGKQLDGVGSADKDMDDTTVHLGSYIAMDKSIPEKFHQDLDDSQEIQPCRTSEFQLPNYYSDGFSSDWEHVEKSM